MSRVYLVRPSGLPAPVHQSVNQVEGVEPVSRMKGIVTIGCIIYSLPSISIPDGMKMDTNEEKVDGRETAILCVEWIDRASSHEKGNQSKDSGNRRSSMLSWGQFRRCRGPVSTSFDLMRGAMHTGSIPSIVRYIA